MIEVAPPVMRPPGHADRRIRCTAYPRCPSIPSSRAVCLRCVRGAAEDGDARGERASLDVVDGQVGGRVGRVVGVPGALPALGGHVGCDDLCAPPLPVGAVDGALLGQVGTAAGAGGGDATDDARAVGGPHGRNRKGRGERRPSCKRLRPGDCAPIAQSLSIRWMPHMVGMPRPEGLQRWGCSALMAGGPLGVHSTRSVQGVMQ